MKINIQRCTAMELTVRNGRLSTDRRKMDETEMVIPEEVEIIGDNALAYLSAIKAEKHRGRGIL